MKDRIDTEELAHDRALDKNLQDRENYIKETHTGILLDLFELKKVDDHTLIDYLETHLDFRDALRAIIAGEPEQLKKLTNTIGQLSTDLAQEIAKEQFDAGDRL